VEDWDVDTIALNLAPNGGERSASCPSHVTSKEKRL